MCGRASLTTPDWETIRAILDAAPDAEEAAAYAPRYNVAPTQLHPILRVVDGARRLQRGSWGLPPIENRAVINARAESVASPSSMWAEALRQRRCVVPVDGFYEWSGEQPFWFHPPDGGLLLLAGLWEQGPDRARFVIVTTAANALVAEAHDRMPAILPPACIADWLARPALELLVPARLEALQARAVSTRVNSTANDDPRLLEPVRPRTQLSLF
ncbi:MAG TPA: SOS response-associated peptidase [Polyangia bacterium]